jgi:hypothetical protein
MKVANCNYVGLSQRLQEIIDNVSATKTVLQEGGESVWANGSGSFKDPVITAKDKDFEISKRRHGDHFPVYTNDDFGPNVRKMHPGQGAQHVYGTAYAKAVSMDEVIREMISEDPQKAAEMAKAIGNGELYERALQALAHKRSDSLGRLGVVVDKPAVDPPKLEFVKGEFKKEIWFWNTKKFEGVIEHYKNLFVNAVKDSFNEDGSPREPRVKLSYTTKKGFCATEYTVSLEGDGRLVHDVVEELAKIE